ncbi:MAG TPA: Gfo/Idh/MocA family oxidoreductase [Bryobacteraceae bacterium]|nr:Gfo/Idh/MocA family oxidoreductase [Bryobacteraceae bacterium]
MYRRQMIAAAAGATLAHAAPTGERIPIAFAGGSHSHAEAKAKICRDSADWDFLGVWEDDPAFRTKYEAANIKLLTSEQVFNGPARVIAVEGAVKDHFQFASRALARGKHVHVEKPPADTLEGMQRLVAAARAKNLLLQSGYMWRYHPGFNKVIEAVRSGWLGEIYMIRGQINTLIEPRRRPEWGQFHGGQMFELGAHLIDALVRVMGVPMKVTPFLRKQGVFKDSLRDNTMAVFEYSRALAVIQSATLQPGSSAHRCFEVLGTNGTAIIRPLEAPELSMDLATAVGPYKKGLQNVPLPPYKRYVDDLAELAAAVRGERKLVVSLDQELDVQKTLLAASEM